MPAPRDRNGKVMHCAPEVSTDFIGSYRYLGKPACWQLATERGHCACDEVQDALDRGIWVQKDGEVYNLAKPFRTDTLAGEELLPLVARNVFPDAYSYQNYFTWREPLRHDKPSSWPALRDPQSPGNRDQTSSTSRDFSTRNRPDADDGQRDKDQPDEPANADEKRAKAQKQLDEIEQEIQATQTERDRLFSPDHGQRSMAEAFDDQIKRLKEVKALTAVASGLKPNPIPCKYCGGFHEPDSPRPQVVFGSFRATSPQRHKAATPERSSASSRYSVISPNAYNPGSPKYSPTSPEVNNISPVSPRYPSTTPGENNISPVSPRYSSISLRENNLSPVSPRYSSTSPEFKPNSPLEYGTTAPDFTTHYPAPIAPRSPRYAPASRNHAPSGSAPQREWGLLKLREIFEKRRAKSDSFEGDTDYESDDFIEQTEYDYDGQTEYGSPPRLSEPRNDHRDQRQHVNERLHHPINRRHHSNERRYDHNERRHKAEERQRDRHGRLDDYHDRGHNSHGQRHDNHERHHEFNDQCSHNQSHRAREHERNEMAHANMDDRSSTASDLLRDVRDLMHSTGRKVDDVLLAIEYMFNDLKEARDVDRYESHWNGNYDGMGRPAEVEALALVSMVRKALGGIEDLEHHSAGLKRRAKAVRNLGLHALGQIAGNLGYVNEQKGVSITMKPDNRGRKRRREDDDGDDDGEEDNLQGPRICVERLNTRKKVKANDSGELIE